MPHRRVVNFPFTDRMLVEEFCRATAASAPSGPAAASPSLAHAALGVQAGAAVAARLASRTRRVVFLGFIGVAAASALVTHALDAAWYSRAVRDAAATSHEDRGCAAVSPAVGAEVMEPPPFAQPLPMTDAPADPGQPLPPTQVAPTDTDGAIHGELAPGTCPPEVALIQQFCPVQ